MLLAKFVMKNQTKDEHAYQMLLLKLSSDGQTIDDLQRDIVKKERLRTVLDAKISKERDRLAKQFEYLYAHGGEKDFVQKVFKEKEGNKPEATKGNNGNMLTKIKDWANYSLDESLKAQNRDLKFVNSVLTQNGLEMLEGS